MVECPSFTRFTCGNAFEIGRELDLNVEVVLTSEYKIKSGTRDIYKRVTITIGIASKIGENGYEDGVG